MPNFPGAVDSYTTKVDDVDVIFASHINGLQSAIVLLEQYAYQVFNVRTYGGAVGDGVHNDATAINNCITAAGSAGGGIVFLPQGTYSCAATVSMNSDNVILRGSGWGTIIKAANGLNTDLIASPVGTGSSFVRNYMGIENLQIDGNKSNQSAGSALRPYGWRYSHIDKVFIQNAYNQCIMMDSDPGNIGYQNWVTRCITDVCGGSVYENGHEGCFFAYNIFKWCDGNYMFRCEKGAHTIFSNIFGGGGTTTGPAVWMRNNLVSKITHNRFDSSPRACIQLDAGNQIVENNECKDACASGSNLAPAISTGGGVTNCIIRGNRVYAFSAVQYSYAYQENGNDNIITDNQFQTGVSGVINMGSATTNFVRDNKGFNPQGVAAITVGASPFVYTNNDNVEEAVYITGGTITTVAKNSITVFSHGGAAADDSVVLMPGESITVTYTVAPTMNKDRK